MKLPGVYPIPYRILPGRIFPMASGVPPWERHFYAHLSDFVLLGSLVFFMLFYFTGSGKL